MKTPQPSKSPSTIPRIKIVQDREGEAGIAWESFPTSQAPTDLARLPARIELTGEERAQLISPHQNQTAALSRFISSGRNGEGVRGLAPDESSISCLFTFFLRVTVVPTPPTH